MLASIAWPMVIVSLIDIATELDNCPSCAERPIAPGQVQHHRLAIDILEAQAAGFADTQTRGIRHRQYRPPRERFDRVEHLLNLRRQQNGWLHERLLAPRYDQYEFWAIQYSEQKPQGADVHIMRSWTQLLL